MSRNILITGGAGYVGGAITDYYLNCFSQNNINIYVYDVILYEESYRKKINFIYGDIRNTDYLLEICNKYQIDTVIWLAAIVGDEACNINMLLTREINVDSLKKFSDKFEGKIIFTSSASTYGIQENNELLTEKDKTDPVSLYGHTKLECENILKNKNAIIFRMGTLFGLGDTYSRIRFDLVINKLVLNAIRDKHLVIYGGDQYRPFLHVKDAAKIILTSSFTNHIGIFNICYCNEKIKNLVPLLKKHFSDIKIEIQAMDFKDTRNYMIDNQKAKKKLLFNPKNNIEIGILEMKKLLEKKRIKNLNNIRYSNFLYLDKEINSII